MTNEHNFKVGDKVKIEIPGLIDIGEIIGENAIGGYNVKCGENYHYGVSEAYLKLTSLDRRTAFLIELQALLRKYDARICDHDDYKLYVEIDHHRDKKLALTISCASSIPIPTESLMPTT